MRFFLAAILCVVTSILFVQASAPPAQTTGLTPEMKARVLDAMRLNRRAFQAPAILARYEEERLPKDHPPFAS